MWLLARLGSFLSHFSSDLGPYSCNTSLFCDSLAIRWADTRSRFMHESFLNTCASHYRQYAGRISCTIRETYARVATRRRHARSDISTKHLDISKRFRSLVHRGGKGAAAQGSKRVSISLYFSKYIRSISRSMLFVECHFLSCRAFKPSSQCDKSWERKCWHQTTRTSVLTFFSLIHETCLLLDMIAFFSLTL